MFEPIFTSQEDEMEGKSITQFYLLPFVHQLMSSE
jgi:hypothetical protein